jgi:hypothetical protein
MAQHFDDIVKCLRDGLSSSDPSYVRLCLSILLDHFYAYTEHLQQTPQDATKTPLSVYYPLLKELYEKHKNDED